MSNNNLPLKHLPEPLGDMRDPYVVFREEGIRPAFVELERLLRQPERRDAYCAFVRVLDDCAALSEDQVESTVLEVSERGLIELNELNERVDPHVLQRILRSPDVLDYLCESVANSESTHWRDTSIDDMLAQIHDAPTYAEWHEEPPADDAVVGRISRKARSQGEPSAAREGTKGTSQNVARWMIAAAALFVIGFSGVGFGVAEWRRLSEDNAKLATTNSQLETEVSKRDKQLTTVQAALSAERDKQVRLATDLAEKDRLLKAANAEREEQVRLAYQERWRRLSNPIVTPVPAVGPPTDSGVELTHEVIVNLDKDIRPDTFTKVEVCWDFDPNKIKPGSRPNEPERDFNDWETLYYWRSTPLTPSVHHRYEHDANQPPRRVTTKFRYWPVANPKVRENLGLSATDDKLVRSFTIESRPEGIVWNKAIVPDGTQVALSSAEVSKDGLLSLEVAAWKDRADREYSTDQTTLHVVLRAKDGSGPWEPGPHSRYAVVDERIAVAGLGSEQVPRHFDVNLPSMFGFEELSTDVRPTEVEVLVVALPFDMGRAIVTSNELSDAVVLKSVTAKWPTAQQIN